MSAALKKLAPGLRKVLPKPDLVLAGLQPDRAEIRRFLKWLQWTGTNVRELAGRGGKLGNGSLHGFFRKGDLDAMVEAVVTLHDRGAGLITVTINQVKDALYARAAARLVRGLTGQSTGDSDIVGRQYVPVDFDPDRPSGVPSTKVEHDAAHARAQEFKAWCAREGLPEPLIGDSGNGAHALIPVDLPADDGGLVHRFLLWVASEFGDGPPTHVVHERPHICVDISVSPAKQNWRVYGTVNRKGDSTEERPHRPSCIISLPETPEPAKREVIDRFALPPAPFVETRKRGDFCYDIPALCAEHGFNIIKTRAWQPTDGAEAGTIYTLRTCPAIADGDTTPHSGGAYIGQLANGAVFVKCFHNRHADFGWAELRERYGIKPPARAQAQYFNRDGKLWIAGDDDHPDTVLASFEAQWIAEILMDEGDGAQTKVYELEIRAPGQEPIRFSVEPGELEQVREWINREAPHGTTLSIIDNAERRLVNALRTMLPGPERRLEYHHLGWTRINDQDVYLHADGAIGAGGPVPHVRATVRDQLAQFKLPWLATEDERRAAVRASLDLRHLGPARIMVTLLAATYYASLGYRNDFALVVHGTTGTFKSSLAALCQQHYGSVFGYNYLPRNFDATSNFNLAMSYFAKDTLLVIDDYATDGSYAARMKLIDHLERLIRQTGNMGDRGRLDRDSNMRPERKPRSLPLITAEQPPGGRASIGARAPVIEVVPGDFTVEVIERELRRGKTGVFAASNATWIEWIASQGRDELIAWMDRGDEPDIKQFRTKPALLQLHPRLQTTLKCLAQTYYLLIRRFAVDTGVYSAAEAATIFQQGLAALEELVPGLQTHAQGRDPLGEFFAYLASNLSAGTCWVHDGHTRPEIWGWIGSDRDGLASPRPGAPCVGKLSKDRQRLALDLKAALSVISKGLPAGKVLVADVDELARVLKPYVGARDPRHLTKVTRVDGNRIRTFDIPVSLIYTEAELAKPVFVPGPGLATHRKLGRPLGRRN